MAAQPYLKLNLEEKTDQRWEFKGLCVLCLTFGVVALESWQVSINFCSSTRMSFKCSFTWRGGTRQTGGCIKVRHQTGALCGTEWCVCVCDQGELEHENTSKPKLSSLFSVPLAADTIMLTLYAALDSGPAPTRSGQSFKDGYCDSMLWIFSLKQGIMST